MQRKGNTLHDVIDIYTGELVTYSKVTQFHDGSAMSDGKCDGIIYRKVVTDGVTEYFKRNVTGVVNARWFGVGDGVSDGSVGLQKAVDYIETTSLKGLIIDTDINLVNPVSIRRGGFNILGTGALLREESWGALHAPEVFTTNKPFNGAALIANDNKAALVFERTVTDPIYIKGIQFKSRTGRIIGTTTGVHFKGEFEGPTWPFIIEECHFRGLNYAVKFESPVQYCVAFVQINRCAFSQNDECIYFSDLALGSQTSVGQRNMTWGFTFTHNKCHDNSRVVRGAFGKDLVTISDNNGEGNIAYANGLYPDYILDIEFSNCSVKLEGNHFEGVTGVKACVRASSEFMLSNGQLQPGGGTTQNSSLNRLYLKGNNFDGISGNISPIEANGCYVFNEDSYRIDGAGTFLDNTYSHSPILYMSSLAKTDGAIYRFPVDGTQNRTINNNQITWSKSLKYNGEQFMFLLDTPLGARQMMYASTQKTQSIGVAPDNPDWGNNIKFIGATFLVNSSYRSDFFGELFLFRSYIDNGVLTSGTISTRHSLIGVPNGWSLLTAYFPNPFPSTSTDRTAFIGLPTSGLQDKAVLVGCDFTVFGIENPDPQVVPYLHPDVSFDNMGTVYKGQSIIVGGVPSRVTSDGTIGTLTGVTATGAATTDMFITVNDGSKLTIGQRISIASRNYWIRNIDGNKVFLNDPLLSTFTNSAVSFKAPTLAQYGSGSGSTTTFSDEGFDQPQIA